MGTFKHLRGYDEEGTFGSGFQDVDLIRRAKSFPHTSVTATKKTSEESHQRIGFPIPNAENTRDDRNISKICNCYNPNGYSWGEVNQINHTLMTERLAAGQIVRNLHVASIDRLGWPFLVTTIVMSRYELLKRSHM